MKKETIEIKAAYMAPEIRVHEVRAQQSFMSGNIDPMVVDDEPWEWENFE